MGFLPPLLQTRKRGLDPKPEALYGVCCTGTGVLGSLPTTLHPGSLHGLTRVDHYVRGTFLTRPHLRRKGPFNHEREAALKLASENRHTCPVYRTKHAPSPAPITPSRWHTPVKHLLLVYIPRQAATKARAAAPPLFSSRKTRPPASALRSSVCLLLPPRRKPSPPRPPPPHQPPPLPPP